MENPETRDMLTRLFGGDVEGRMLAQRMTKGQLSGIFDAEVQVNPEASFDKQVLITLAQVISPAIQTTYAAGQRELLKRIWEAFDQKGFEQIWPAQVAATQTQIQILTQQLQLEQLRTQLQAMEAQRQQMEQQTAIQGQAQQLLQQGQGVMQQMGPGDGETSAPFSRAVLQHLQRQAQAQQNGGAAAPPGGVPPV